MTSDQLKIIAIFIIVTVLMVESGNFIIILFSAQVALMILNIMYLFMDGYKHSFIKKITILFFGLFVFLYNYKKIKDGCYD